MATYLTLNFPPGIEFSDTLTLTPDLTELGIPQPLSCIAFIKSHKSIGDWVNRGETLVDVCFEQFESESAPSGLMFFLNDKVKMYTFTLNAPASGLVLDLRQTFCRATSKGHSGFTYTGLIGKRFCLPSILTARDEPPISAIGLNRFAQEINSYVYHNWRLNRHNLGSRNKYSLQRLATISEQDFRAGFEHSLSCQTLAAAVASFKNTGYHNMDLAWQHYSMSRYVSKCTGLLTPNLIREYREVNSVYAQKLRHL